MTTRGTVFADTAFWVALVVKQDEDYRQAGFRPLLLEEPE